MEALAASKSHPSLTIVGVNTSGATVMVSVCTRPPHRCAIGLMRQTSLHHWTAADLELVRRFKSSIAADCIDSLDFRPCISWLDHSTGADHRSRAFQLTPSVALSLSTLTPLPQNGTDRRQCAVALAAASCGIPARDQHQHRLPLPLRVLVYRSLCRRQACLTVTATVCKPILFYLEDREHRCSCQTFILS